MAREKELAIATVLEGFASGLNRGLQRRQQRADKDRAFELDNRRLDIKEKQASILSGIKEDLSEAKRAKIGEEGLTLKTKRRLLIGESSRKFTDQKRSILKDLEGALRKLSFTEKQSPGSELHLEAQRSVDLLKEARDTTEIRIQDLNSQLTTLAGVPSGGGPKTDFEERRTQIQALMNRAALPGSSAEEVVGVQQEIEDLIPKIAALSLTPAQKIELAQQVARARAVAKASAVGAKETERRSTIENIGKAGFLGG